MTGWNKGLTKETDSRIMQISKNISEWANTDEGKEFHRKQGIQFSQEMKGKQPKHLVDYWESPESRLVKSDAMRLLWILEPERFAACSRKGVKLTEEHKEKLRKEGINSISGYPKEFFSIRDKIKERDGHQCQLCGVGEGILVHHIDYDKKNCGEENLITLCRKCHCKLNYDNVFWKYYFQHKEYGLEPLYCGIDVMYAHIVGVYLDSNGNFVDRFIIKCGHFKTSDSVREFAYRLRMNVTALRPSKVFIELPIYIQNMQTTFKLSETYAMTLLLLNECYLEAHGVQNTTWKKVILKNGGANKEVAMNFAKERWGSEVITSQDVADAACLALHCVNSKVAR